MRLTLCFSLILFSLFVAAQESSWTQLEENSELSSVLFLHSDSILNPLTILTPNGVYDGVPDSSKYEVQSDCIINADPRWRIRFANAKRENDTLKIEIQESNPALDPRVWITVHGNVFKAEYFFYASGPRVDRKFKTVDQRLSLKKSDLSKGERLEGHIYLKSECVKGCQGKYFEIEGFFKALIE